MNKQVIVPQEDIDKVNSALSALYKYIDSLEPEDPVVSFLRIEVTGRLYYITHRKYVTYKESVWSKISNWFYKL